MDIMRSMVIGLTIIGFGLADLAASPRTRNMGRNTENPRPKRRQVWAVGPCVNLSGERGVDPFLQADLLFHKLQEVQG